MSQFKELFSPINIGEMKLKNRIVLAPMSTNYATEKGSITERIIQYYMERAKGEVGLIISESNYVSLEGRGGVNRLGLHSDRQIKDHRKFTQAIHDLGTPVCAQLHHAGAAASMKAVGQYPVSCSTVTLLSRQGPFGGNIPRRLSESEIKDLMQCFLQAALRAKESEYDAVMVHATHGYLIHQFLSPHTNKRSDQYGGSEENRARFLLEICKLIRKLLGSHFPIMVRLTAKELLDGGYGIDFTEKLAVWLENVGVNEIGLSSGSKEEVGGSCAPPAYPEGFRADDSEVIKKKVKIPVGVVGRIMSPETAEQIIQAGKADLIYLGRALIADPEFAIKAKTGREDEIRPCIVCNRGCIDCLRADVGIKCSVNPSVGKEALGRTTSAKRSKKLMIVGGGPAGMEAARVAALRGHQVTLCEKSNKLGGNLNKAIFLPHKEQIEKLIQYYVRQMELLGVTIQLDTKVTPDMVEELRPEVLVVAAGAQPIRLGLAGSNLPHVFLAEDCLDGKISLGPKILIIGGGLVGTELADVLTEKGKRVIIVEQLDSVANQLGNIIKEELLIRLCSKGLKIMVNTRVLAISHEGVLVERFGEKETIEANTVIIATGYQSSKELIQNLDIGKMPFHEIGDCVKPRMIMEAVEEGNRIGLEI